MPPGNNPSDLGGEADDRHPREVTRANHFVDTSALLPEGLARNLYRLIQPATEYVFGFPDMWQLHADSVYSPFEPSLIAQRTFDALDLTLEIDPSDVQKIAAIEGPLVIAANHPFGGIDAVALIQLLERVRPGGWRLLANTVVCSIEGFAEHCIPLDPLGVSPASKRLNLAGLQATSRHLKKGGVIGLFPAGRVSHRQKHLRGQVADRPWSPHFLRQAARARATVVCLHFRGNNSRLFLKVPARYPKLRALFLTRQLTHPSVKKVQMQLAEVFPPNEVTRLAASARGVDELRAACFLRPDLDVPRADPTPSPSIDIRAPEETHPDEMLAEMEAIEAPDQGRLLDTDRFTVYFAQGRSIPKTLRALGCGREITFRAAGQGTGQACDLSPEDDYYHHFLLWDRDKARLAGAYRAGHVGQILAEHGAEGLYLNHVFEIKPQFHQLMGPSFELSRSYILPEYQGDPDALASLWKAVGAATSKLGIKTLFGSVTISNDYAPASRAILVEYLRANHLDSSEMRSQVNARNPFRPTTRYHRLVAKAYQNRGIQKLAPVIKRIENGERGIPPLLRYYCNLNARFVDFHVEAAFGNSLYCLLRVDIGKMTRSYQKRFGFAAP